MFAIKLVSKGISGGIGLASEAIADHKEKKAAREQVRPVPSDLSTTRGSSYNTQFERVGDHKPHDDDSSSIDSEDLDDDRAQWALDDAAQELQSPPPYDEKTPASSDEVAISFLQNHRISQQPQTYSSLPLPVILPQRRPKDRSRGFIRAYPPLLGECAGIDQPAFMDFLRDFDRASRASPVFNVINIAAFAVGFIPSPIAMGVSIAVQVANGTAKELTTRYKTNTFLDQINESLFKPRGLYCMIMTFKPDNPYEPVLGVNVNSADLALSRSLSEPESDLRKKLRNIRLASGTTSGEMSLPECAPLVYPALDAAAQSGQSLPEQKQNRLVATGGFLNTYLDRRAQATYAGMNRDSKLQYAPPQKQFASRFSDPNHPVNSGSLVSLITGGKINPLEGKRVRKAQRRAWRHGVQLSQQDLENAKMGRGPTRNKGIIRRIMHKDVLYMIIVNLPSEVEMMEMRKELERVQQQQKKRGYEGNYR